MKNKYIIWPVSLLFVFLLLAFTIMRHAAKDVTNTRGFALVELYTSEGCSSCPPADKLVAKIQQAYQGKEVYILAYHVDYWNRLGWKDVFSSAQYSQRQRNYADYLKLDEVYTPQVIVNGDKEFIGSDEGKMRNAIQESLNKDQAVTLSLTNLKQDNKKISLQYHINGSLPGNNSLYLAVVQKHAQTIVKAGENDGHTLTHINIVNRLENFSLKNSTGVASIGLPDSYNNRDWDIISFVQNNRNGEIMAVQKVMTENI